MPEFARLDSPACTAIWELPPGEAPLWRYWGPRLPDGAMPREPLRATRPEPSFSLHHDMPLSICPGAGMGWFGEAGLRAHRAGADWTFAPTDCTAEPDGPHSLRFVLADPLAGVCVAITARLDPATDTLTLATTLTNTGAGVLDVAWLAAGVLPLPEDAATVESFGGRHNAEFVPVTDTLTRSTWRRENRRGLTSHDCFPGAVVRCADGTAYGAHLAWSGNHVQTIEWLDDGRRQWQWGEGLAPGEVRLAAGETLTSPELLATCAAEGANGVTHAFHRAMRARIAWPGEPGDQKRPGGESGDQKRPGGEPGDQKRPGGEPGEQSRPGGAMSPRKVHLNTWEAFYFTHDLAALCELADAAAAIGIERFVLDDGWFAGRDDDTSSLGDWYPDPAVYPEGLGPLAAHVTGLGMEFGLWLEPEMINPDSDLYRAHPDWALHIAGRPLLTARHQLVLDMARPEVSDYLYARIHALLADLPIGYVKWDHNRDLTHAGAQPRFRQQVLATYALLDRLRAAFPAVEIEACAGGGGRIDAGILSRSHRFWTSDCIDAVSRVGIQRGFLRFFPPEIMGSHVGASPAHSTGRMQAMDFRCGVALPGHFGVELDVRKLAPAERDGLARGIARYKALRGRLHRGRVWLGEAPDGLVWQAHGDATEMILLVARTTPTTWRHQPHLRLPMAQPGRIYRVVRDGAVIAAMDGALLARQGFAVPPMAGEAVLVLEVAAA